MKKSRSVALVKLDAARTLPSAAALIVVRPVIRRHQVRGIVVRSTHINTGGIAEEVGRSGRDRDNRKRVAVGSLTVDEVGLGRDATRGLARLENARTQNIDSRHGPVRGGPGIVVWIIGRQDLVAGNPRVGRIGVAGAGQRECVGVNRRTFRRIRPVQGVTNDRIRLDRGYCDRLAVAVDAAVDRKDRRDQRYSFRAARVVQRCLCGRGVEIQRIEGNPGAASERATHCGRPRCSDSQRGKLVDDRRAIRGSKNDRFATRADGESSRPDLPGIVGASHRAVGGITAPDEEISTCGDACPVGELVFDFVGEAVREVMTREIEGRTAGVVEFDPIEKLSVLVGQPGVRRLHLVDVNCGRRRVDRRITPVADVRCVARAVVIVVPIRGEEVRRIDRCGRAGRTGVIRIHRLHGHVYLRVGSRRGVGVGGAGDDRVRCWHAVG